MKKLLVSVLAAFMVLSISSAALAMSNGDLIAVVYNETDNEVGLNLGTLAGMDFTLQNQTLVEAGTFSLADFSAISSFDDLSVGIFGANGYNFYFATTVDTAPAVSAAGFNGFFAANSAVSGYYGSGDKGVKLAGGLDSYDVRMNSNSNAPGLYAGFNAHSSVGEGGLSDDGYVDMYLYNFLGVDLVSGVTADYQAVLRISADGSIIMNPTEAEVPLPGAVILLGSGLLGLAGIRRKK